MNINLQSISGREMGSFYLNLGTINNFKVEEVEDPEDHKVLYLTIKTNSTTIKYRICEDLNEGPLQVIKDTLIEALNLVIENESHFTIYEHTVRNYLYIKFPDGKQKKYTGQRLE